MSPVNGKIKTTLNICQNTKTKALPWNEECYLSVIDDDVLLKLTWYKVCLCYARGPVLCLYSHVSYGSQLSSPLSLFK